MQIRIQAAASQRLDEIYRYTRARWSEEQAYRYITGLFGAFDSIRSHPHRSKYVPAEFEVDGFYLQYEMHFIDWRWLANDDIGIVTILHQRMHQFDRFREDVEP